MFEMKEYEGLKHIIYIYIYIYIHIHTRARAHAHTHIYIRFCVCVYLCIYIYIEQGGFSFIYSIRCFHGILNYYVAQKLQMELMEIRNKKF